MSTDGDAVTRGVRQSFCNVFSLASVPELEAACTTEAMHDVSSDTRMLIWKRRPCLPRPARSPQCKPRRRSRVIARWRGVSRLCSRREAAQHRSSAQLAARGRPATECSHSGETCNAAGRVRCRQAGARQPQPINERNPAGSPRSVPEDVEECINSLYRTLLVLPYSGS